MSGEKCPDTIQNTSRHDKNSIWRLKSKMEANNNQNALKIFIIMIQPSNLVGLRVLFSTYSEAKRSNFSGLCKEDLCSKCQHLMQKHIEGLTLFLTFIKKIVLKCTPD